MATLTRITSLAACLPRFRPPRIALRRPPNHPSRENCASASPGQAPRSVVARVPPRSLRPPLAKFTDPAA
ncbi:uncharacterized protein PHACADRAFT_250324 [Phanerochaete carnosa HHB-10118-sp]|uniref:Uncharacterized protein n=1 Tax=Phanerochaete carnosa (strain HHB-10118-sp) TaxID=650164 RepID=K5X9T9_PHACS|nr:uncharacterized protein PHACADRAFT_250324 [Phanerochaete carnosa HHB-10118-sp]EKM59677.1 hypothetical protein PHACADRAFT_250324 [Phanerochaete carnosa HHB-10118-sp]